LKIIKQSIQRKKMHQTCQNQIKDRLTGFKVSARKPLCLQTDHDHFK
jgi:hypothetical protein